MGPYVIYSVKQIYNFGFYRPKTLLQFRDPPSLRKKYGCINPNSPSEKLTQSVNNQWQYSLDDPHTWA